MKQEDGFASGALERGGGFVGTNLAGARAADQPGDTSGWSETFTACEFLYQFVTGEPSNRRPISIPRTYISVYVSEPRAPPFWPRRPWPVAPSSLRWPVVLGPWPPPPPPQVKSSPPPAPALSFLVAGL